MELFLKVKYIYRDIPLSSKKSFHTTKEVNQFIRALKIEDFLGLSQTFYDFIIKHARPEAYRVETKTAMAFLEELKRQDFFECSTSLAS